MDLAPGTQKLTDIYNKVSNLSEEERDKVLKEEGVDPESFVEAVNTEVDQYEKGLRTASGSANPAMKSAEKVLETPREKRSLFSAYAPTAAAQTEGSKTFIAGLFQGIETLLDAPDRIMDVVDERAAAIAKANISDELSEEERKQEEEKINAKLKEKKGKTLLGDSFNFVNEQLQKTSAGKVTSNVIQELNDPLLDENQKTAADIVSMAVPLKAAFKITKLAGMKPGYKKRLTEFMIFDTFYKNENDHQFSEFIVQTVPATAPVLEKLFIDPNDSASEKELKKIIDTALSAGLFEGFFGAAGLTIKGAKIGGKHVYDKTKIAYNNLDTEAKQKVLSDVVERVKSGTSENIKRVKAIADDKILKPVTNSKTKLSEYINGKPAVVDTKVTEMGDIYVQQSSMSQVKGSLNTILARILKTKGQLPDPLVKPFRKRQENYQASVKEIQTTVDTLKKDLNKAKKAASTVDEANEITENTRRALNGGADELAVQQKNVNTIVKKTIDKEKINNSRLPKEKRLSDEELLKKETQLIDDTVAAVSGDADAFLRLPQPIRVALEDARNVMGISDDALSKLPIFLQDTIRQTKRNINNNNTLVKNLYNLKESDDIIISISDDGTSYITRAYEIFTNPKWAASLKDGIEARAKIGQGLPISKKLQKSVDSHTPEFNAIIDEAFKNLKARNPKVEDDVLWGVLDDFATKGSSKDKGLIFEALSSKRYELGPNPVQVLSKRKELNKPILDFLGEIKDPVRMVDETLRQQTKAITLGEYAREVEKFILTNEGKNVALQGFFESFPKASTTFLPKKLGSVPEVNVPVGEGFSGIAGSVGASAERLLPKTANYQTSKTMANVLERGTEMFGYNRDLGGPLGYLIAQTQRLASFGQSTQTVLDAQQHMVNAYGMVQILASSGALTRPKVFNRIAGETKKSFINSEKQNRKVTAAINKYKLNPDVVDAAILGNKTAYDSLPKPVQKIINTSRDLVENKRLKAAGVLDSSIITKPIRNATLDRWGDPKTSSGWVNTITTPFRYGQKIASQAYGFTDDFGKKIIFKTEMDDLRKIYPNKSYDELFDIAAENTLNVAPSYSHAAPLIRELGKYPVGAYPVYTAEILRTQFSTLKMARKELAEAFKTNNPVLRNKAMYRLAALGGLYAGKEAYRKFQEAENGWSQNDVDGIKSLLPTWQQSSIQIPTQEIYFDPSDKHVKTKFVDGSTLDSHSYIRGPLQRLTALGYHYTGNDELSEPELDEMYKGIVTDMASQYYAIKGLYGGVSTAVSGVDEYGRPIRRGVSLADDLAATLSALGAPLNPGTASNAGRYYESLQSEELLGENMGKTKSGFPNRSKEQKAFLMTGVRHNTFDISRTLGSAAQNYYFTQKDIKDSFSDYLTSIPVGAVSGELKVSTELLNEIKKEYNRYQELNYKNNKKFKSVLDRLSEVEVVYPNKKEKQPFKPEVLIQYVDEIGQPQKDFATVISKNINVPFTYSEEEIISLGTTRGATTKPEALTNILKILETDKANYLKMKLED